ncbi:reverse transcriptase domain-containing protein [Tanacetum coccineum]
MTTLVEKRNSNKFCKFHGEVGHTTDECMHLKRQIEEMLKARKLSHLIKELKQSNGKDQTKASKKGEPSGKDKSLAILMVQPWQRVARQNITQTFSPESVISFPPLEEEDGMEGPMIIESEMIGHCMHRMGKENPGSSIHGSRNAKIPSDRRNGYTTEQQDHSTRMHNGFRTRSATAKEGQKELCGLLRRNLDIFAWKPADMTGVPRHIAEHRLNIREGYRLEDDPLDTIIEDKEELPDPWILFTDRSSCIDGSGAGLIITNLEGMEFTYALRLRVNATNNEGRNTESHSIAESSSEIAKQIGVENAFKQDVVYLQTTLKMFSINKYVEEKQKAEHKQEWQRYVVEEEDLHWDYTKVYEYLQREISSKRKEEVEVQEPYAAKRRCRYAASYVLRISTKGQLLHSMPWFTRSVWVAKAFRALGSPRLVPEPRSRKLTPINSPHGLISQMGDGSHKRWGIDIAGPFLKGPGKVKFLIVVMDYFTKWIEVKLVATIMGAQVKKFM